MLYVCVRGGGEGEIVHVCIMAVWCVCERGRERETACVHHDCVRECVCVRERVCVCERERDCM